MIYLCRTSSIIKDDSNIAHKKIENLITNEKNLSNEKYSQIICHWRKVYPNLFLIETNQDIKQNYLFNIIIPVKYPENGIFKVKYDPLKSINNGNKRGKKVSIIEEPEAKMWVEKRTQEIGEVVSNEYIGYEQNEKFRAHIWEASIYLKKSIDSYYINGCSKSFGLGLLIPEKMESLKLM